MENNENNCTEEVIFICRPSFPFYTRWASVITALIFLIGIPCSLFFKDHQNSFVLLLIASTFVVSLAFAAYGGFLYFSTQYRLTTQRLFIDKGFLNKREEEIELFRIKDVTLTRSLWERIFRVGSIEIISTDDTSPLESIQHISTPVERKEQLRSAVINARKAANLRPAEFIQS